MVRKFIITILIASLIITFVTPQVSYAGGAGGEPLISDSVGWGIVGALVVVGVYFVYVLKNEVPPNKEKTEEKATKLNPVTTGIPMPVAQHGNLIVAKW